MDDIDNRFVYHKPDEAKGEKHSSVRNDMMTIARKWALNLPEGREKSLAIIKLEEAMFWANASIARSNNA